MAPRKNYTQDQINSALEAVARGITVAAAAKQFSVPRVTLLYKSTGKLPVNCRMGPNTILSSDEENILENWILSLANLHHPVSKEQLLDSVQHIIQEKKRPNPFTNSRPGRKWYNSFLKRHPRLSERVAQNLTPARENVTERHIKQWFIEIETYLKSKNLFEVTNIPNRVFNSDESAFFLQPKGGKVLAKKGDKNVYIAGTNDDKTNLTVLVTANAAGDFAPPMVEFKYERIPSHIANSINKEWGIGRSENGWMCGPTFFEYITNVFVPWLNKKQIERPVLMFIDGHVSHMTLHLSQFCSANGIELLALYPNSTHLIQPMDVAVFRPLKSFWKSCVREWHIENNGNKLRKENFGTVLEEALSKVTQETIQNGFKACGISPFNVENVKFGKISNHTENKTPVLSVFKLNEGLKAIEGFIDDEKLKIFKANFNSEWTGNIEDTSLFNVWKSIRQKTQRKLNLDNRIDDENTVGNQAKEAAIDNVEETLQTDVNTSEIQLNIMEEIKIDEKPKEQEREEKIQYTSVTSYPVTPAKIPSTSYPLQEISPNSDNLIHLKTNVPTPFKKALFWPENMKSTKKKQVREKIPSPITSSSWQEYHRKKELEKKTKEKEKQKRAEKRKQKKEEKELLEIKKQAKRKRIAVNSSSSESEEEWVDSGDSLDDISLDLEDDGLQKNLEDEGSQKKLTFEELQMGDFILAKFLGGKRLTMNYRYACIVRQIHTEDDIEVVSLKSVTGKSSFKLIETDVSSINLEDVLEKLPQPEIQGAGDRIKYIFSREIDVFEH